MDGDACTILVVDDDDDIRNTLSEALEIEGYQVARAADGHQALDELRRQVEEHAAPCVVLLDLMMPVMNGFQFIAAQQQEPELANVPVVVISAFGQPQQLPAAGFLPKPVALHKLLTVVERVCKHS